MAEIRDQGEIHPQELYALLGEQVVALRSAQHRMRELEARIPAQHVPLEQLGIHQTGPAVPAGGIPDGE